jgi:hypothetical protein
MLTQVLRVGIDRKVFSDPAEMTTRSVTLRKETSPSREFDAYPQTIP